MLWASILNPCSFDVQLQSTIGSAYHDLFHKTFSGNMLMPAVDDVTLVQGRLSEAEASSAYISIRKIVPRG